MQNVVPLQHDHQFLSLQESVRELCVPDNLVGVERLVAIASFAVNVDVGGKVAAPGEGNPGVAAVGEVPCGEVVRRLQLVLRMSVGGVGVEREVQPLVAEAER